MMSMTEVLLLHGNTLIFRRNVKNKTKKKKKEGKRRKQAVSDKLIRFPFQHQLLRSKGRYHYNWKALGVICCSCS